MISRCETGTLHLSITGVNTMSVRKQPGFSLFEFLISLSIFGILISYGLYNYHEQTLKYHRQDARQSLLYWANRLEMDTTDNPLVYQKLQKGLLSEEGRYRISITHQADKVFVLEAKPINQQQNDTACPYFRLNQQGLYSAPTGCW